MSVAPHLQPIVDAYQPGDDLADVAQQLVTAHADHLRKNSLAGLAIERCPRCGGAVLGDTDPASGTVLCAAGCGWSYRRLGA